MCRFVAYKGHDIFLADLLNRSSQSLIRQSFKATKRAEPLNGDGFGVGWYAHEVDPVPCVFTSMQPAWANRNLKRLSDKIHSTCVFAHVRAASEGSLVTELNCHPFQHKEFLWMHNGFIADFAKIKRKLRNKLIDELYLDIDGTTDSEHAFALFLNYLHRYRDNYNLDRLAAVLAKTIKKIVQWSPGEQQGLASHCNFAVTDGHSIVASRYASGESEEPQSLYLARGTRFEVRDGQYRMIKRKGRVEAIIIASEPLTAAEEDWEPVPRNHIVTVSPEMHVKMKPI
ncbi:MAG: class II glutamine amidotransferase [Gammaproteobacteria bacterium]|nr:class II glutamine amidotransferase [Gammaproteobacteria bacterium]